MNNTNKALFEAWFRAGLGDPFWLNRDGDAYNDQGTESMWQAWQAASAALTFNIADPTDIATRMNADLDARETQIAGLNAEIVRLTQGRETISDAEILEIASTCGLGWATGGKVTPFSGDEYIAQDYIAFARAILAAQSDHIVDANKMVESTREPDYDYEKTMRALNLAAEFKAGAMHLSAAKFWEVYGAPRKTGNPVTPLTQYLIAEAARDDADVTFSRRWRLAIDGFGLQRDDESGNYIHIDDALEVLHQAVSTAKQDDVKREELIAISDGPPIPRSYAEAIYQGWAARSENGRTFEQFREKYPQFLSWKSMCILYRSNVGYNGINAKKVIDEAIAAIKRDDAPTFDQAEFDTLVKKGTKAWAGHASKRDDAAGDARDAERYRWLRRTEDREFIDGIYGMTPSDLDDQIDAAIAASKDAS